MDELNVCIPATVTGIEGENMVNVVCDINRGQMLEGGNRIYEQTIEIDRVPVVMMSCGGFSFNMPIKAGCKGLLIFCDYDNDDWKSGSAIPHTARTHDLNDPFFFPAFNGGRIDTDNLEIKSETTTLTIGDGFDVTHNGESLIDTLNSAFSSCCNGSTPFDDWKP